MYYKQLDSIHHIRIQRSFTSKVDPDFSRMNPDSLYFDPPDAEVRLIRADGDTVEY